ncbi:MAPEG family protein [Phenylobacterium terrae]|uniref:MAPEG family protein n=1 Tax=Phenylobacterium terrae TaxID=2665495 RepID=A0ABW4N593_9CAUL
MTLRWKQAISLGQIAAAMLVSLAVAFGDWPVFGLPRPPPAGDAERLALALLWMLVPALCLLQGLGAASAYRLGRADAVDGQREGVGRLLEIVLRYNTNTLEQGFLALVAWCGLALTLPADQLGLVPRLALLFAAGRILFFWGYLIAPPLRVFGMGLTAYPTYGALLWLLWRAVQGA